ncbi:MAG: TIGR04282 family arsenosugar biosynthesis glycosyltransferase [Xanthobacteraceae bacterium]
MAKASSPGRTKTRLVPPLTFDEAAAMNSAFLQDTIANIMAANLSHAINGYVAFGPPECKAFFDGILPFSIQQLEAWYPNFGDCLFSAIDQVLNRGHHGAVVLNSDSPTLPTSLLVETARVLARPGDRVVLGPSVDGGYYLLGLKERHRRLFEDVMWSTEQVARQTLERAAQVGIEVHVLPTWYDVDEVAALNILLSELCDGGSFSPTLKPYEAPSSKHLVCSLLKDTDLPSRLERKRDRSKQMVMP